MNAERFCILIVDSGMDRLQAAVWSLFILEWRLLSVWTRGWWHVVVQLVVDCH